MNEINPQAMLQELRAMAAAARNEAAPSVARAGATPEFLGMLRNAVQQVNALQQGAESTARAFELGQPGVTLPDVMVSMQKAGIAFQGMTQVRNKLVAAYQEIMSMQV